MHRRSLPVSALLGAAVALVTTCALEGAASAHGGSSIEGTVTSADGEPLSGVCVVATRVDSSDAPYSGTTDAAGFFDIAVRGGEYVVAYNRCEQRRPGFAPEYFDDVTDIEQATTVRVEEETTLAGLDAALAPTGSLSGQVTDEDTGEGLDGICVVAQSATDGWTQRVTTGADGDYRVDDLLAGDYVVAFEDCSDPLTHIAGTARATVAAGQETTGVDAALAEGGTVSGVVRSVHTGEEQQSVCVGLFRTGPSSHDTTPDLRETTGTVRGADGSTSRGAFVFKGVPPGTYELAYNAPGCGTDAFTTRWYDDQPTRERAAPITVRKGESVVRLDAVLAPLPSIELACSPSPPESGFSDVPRSNVHAAALDCTTDRGVTTGRPDGTYRPGDPVLRGQLASFVARTLSAMSVGLPSRPADAFDDDEGSVHELAIDQLAALGIVRGTGDRRFSPEQPVNRAQMAAFLVHAYQHATGLTLHAPVDRFVDDDGTTHEASIDRAATAGFTAGTADPTRYQPFAPVRRDQMASFLARLLDRAERDTT